MDNEKKAQEIVRLITAMLAPIPRDNDVNNDPGFWCNGSTILCPSETECEIVAEFFGDVLREFSSLEIVTGRYDPYEMQEKEDQNETRGFYYIRFEGIWEDGK